jgi:hypothetical protein
MLGANARYIMEVLERKSKHRIDHRISCRLMCNVKICEGLHRNSMHR